MIKSNYIKNDRPVQHNDNCYILILKWSVVVWFQCIYVQKGHNQSILTWILTCVLDNNCHLCNLRASLLRQTLRNTVKTREKDQILVKCLHFSLFLFSLVSMFSHTMWWTLQMATVGLENHLEWFKETNLRREYHSNF